MGISSFAYIEALYGLKEATMTFEMLQILITEKTFQENDKFSWCPKGWIRMGQGLNPSSIQVNEDST